MIVLFIYFFLSFISNQILEAAASIDRALAEQKGAAFVKRLHASLPKINNKSSDQSASSADGTLVAGSSSAGPSLDASEDNVDEIRKVYEKWAREVAFEYCDLKTQGHDSESFRHVHSGGS